MKIYVANLSEEVTVQHLRNAFKRFGQVEYATIILDRISGRPRGFGFVEMLIEAEALAAISGLNGNELKGRTIFVEKARPLSKSG